MTDIELPFPYAGIDKSLSKSRQAPFTTDEVVNMLPTDMTTGIVRGAKRPGLNRAGSAAVTSAHVQDIAQLTYANPSLVSYTPAATGGGFTGASKWTSPSPNGTTITVEKFDKEGNRYAIDLAGALFKTSSDGKIIWQTSIAKKHPLHVFRGLAIGPNGDVYVGVGRKNELSTTSQEAEFQKKGQESARIYRFAQVELSENVQTAELKWEYATKRFVCDMAIVNSYLVTIEEDVDYGWAWTRAYQSLTVGSPTLRWKKRVPYPSNSLCIAKDGSVYVACEPAINAAGTSLYAQSRRNAQNTLAGTVGPIPGAFEIEDLKKKGFRVWADFRADMVDGITPTEDQLKEGDEITEWTCASGTGRRLTIPSGLFNFPSASNIPAEGPRWIKRGANNLPAVRFMGVTGNIGTPSSLRFQGLVSDPSDSTPEQSESQSRKVLPDYDNGAFVVIVVMAPQFGSTKRMAVLGQDYLSETGVSGVAAGSRIPVTLTVNQSITSGAWSTTASGGQVGLVDPVYVGGSGGANTTSQPSGVSYGQNFNCPVSVNGTQTKAGTLQLPHGYCIATWICDGKFLGSFQDETSFAGTMSQFAVNGSVSDKNRYGAHKHNASVSTLTDFFASTTVGFSDDKVVGFTVAPLEYPGGASGNFDPYQGDIVRILVLNRYDKVATTGLHSTSSDAATADPIIISHTLLPDSTTVLDGDGAPPSGDDLTTYTVSDQVGAPSPSTITVDELELLTAALQWEYGFECLPNTSDGAGPPYEYKANPFASDPCVNRAASGAPPSDASIVVGGPKDPNWLNYPHGCVFKLNGDNGAQIWVAADYSSSANNCGLGVGIAIVQEYGDDESAPSVRKLVSYGPLSNWKNAYARVLTDNGETVTVEAPITLLDPGADAVVIRDRYPKVGADQFGNAFIPGNFLSNYTGDAFTFAIVKKDGTVRLKYDVDGTYHAPCYSAQPDPIAPIYPESVNKMARFVVLGLAQDFYNSVPAIGAATTDCLRKIEIVQVSTPVGLPRLTEYVVACGASPKKYVESAGALSGPSAITAESGAVLAATSFYQKLFVAFEKVFAIDGQTELVYDPKATTPLKLWKAKKGRIPERCLLGASWLQCAVLARPADSPTEIFGSRSGDPFDFDFSPAIRSSKQAWRLQNRAGPQADPVTALIVARDDLLIVTGERSISRLSGHPELGGRLDNISNQVGVLFDAHTRDPEGNIYVATNAMEIAILTESGGLRSLSGDRMREPLQAIDSTKYRLRLAWSARRDMLFVLQVPWASADLGTARTGWVWNRATDGWFEIDFADATLQPTVGLSCRGDTQAMREVLFGSEDGWLRFLDPSIAYDEKSDGTQIRINARVKLQPVVLNGMDQASINSVRVVLADTDDSTEHAQGGADLELYVTESPDVAREAVANVKVLPGHNATIPIAARGCIASARFVNAEVNERFAFERVILDVQDGGSYAP